MTFVKESRIAAPPEVVFAFHESPGALRRLIPPWDDVRVEEQADSIRPGARVVLVSKFGPVPIRWVAEHTEYEPPHRFADRQVSGPFARWYHVHRFLDDGQGGTIMRDEVEYEPPLGLLGRLLGDHTIRQKLQKMFDFRHETVRRIVESGDFPHPAPA
ncbi:SRPBCC family protein [Tautonia sociabilis]|uniref:Cyclase n=1 Tax=Tautonia sociabilis TaxID=2080755 RepID=A0A432MLU3_9BACT|nr:SRPBCC family protein [Tautonia sociabilis]RUL88250.1 cyclase [Tautonia sociabilis]